MTKRSVRQRAGTVVATAVVTGGALALAGPSVAGAAKVADVVRTAKVPTVGTVLVGSGGRTLYVFSPDKQGKPTCTGTCAAAWPPLLASSKAVTGSGIDPSLLGTVKTSGGKLQVTYDRWPLYLFVEDSGPGQAHGQGVNSYGGEWSTITPAGSAFGTKPTGTSAHKTSATSTTGGYGGY
jgi:predicted lipoprotein with Yx(FWY)xxD motif